MNIYTKETFKLEGVELPLIGKCKCFLPSEINDSKANCGEIYLDISHTHAYIYTHKNYILCLSEFWWVNFDAATFDTNDIPDT